MHIYGNGSVTLIKPEIKTELPIPPPEDPLKRVERKSFELALGDRNKLSKQIAADFVSSGPEGSGIKLTRVPKNSIFSSIGLNDGDFVQDVNGEQVANIEEFIEAVQAAADEDNMIRIARIKNNNLMDPIYIELH
jgi:type II secretory pathway component PulC